MLGFGARPGDRGGRPPLETSDNPHSHQPLRPAQPTHRQLPRQLMVMTTTTMINLLSLLLFPAPNLSGAQIIYIPTSPTPAQAEESARIHLAQQDLHNLNKAVEGLEEDYTSLQRMVDSWPTGGVHFNPRPRKRREEDRPREPQRNFYCYNTDSPFARVQKFSLNNLTDCTTKPKKYDDPITVEMTILHKNDQSKLLARSCSVLVTQRVHYCG